MGKTNYLIPVNKINKYGEKIRRKWSFYGNTEIYNIEILWEYGENIRIYENITFIGLTPCSHILSKEQQMCV